MAELWLKIEHGTPDKPQVAAVARQLGLTDDDVFGKFFRVWRYFDKESIDGVFEGIGTGAIDRQAGIKGFAAAAAQVGWLVIEGDGDKIIMPKFSDHCGEGAKRRSLTAWRVAKHAAKTNDELTPPALGEALPRKEKGDRREKNSNRERPDRETPTDRSPKEVSDLGGQEVEPFDLSRTDWDHVRLMAEAVAKKVPPFGDSDRRQWFKFAIMADMTFSEHWLMDSAEAVHQSRGTTKNRSAHFVAVLKSKAAEMGVDASGFKGLLRRIEVPVDLWKSDLLRVRK